MITFNINDEAYSGRFGNQILEIAGTIGLAKKHNVPFAFKYWKYQRYFKHSLPELPKEMIHQSLQIKDYTYRDVQINPKYNYEIANHFFSDGVEYWQSLQSYKYFDHCLDLVQYYFEPAFEVNSIYWDYISVHVRRGDYVCHPLYAQLGKEYYQNAMSIFPKGSKFLIFSDDIEWVIGSKWFSNKDDTFVFPSSYVGNTVLDAPQHLLDWEMMRKCSGHIIANSSYSLSASYLSGKPTIAPAAWFSGRLEKENSTQDLYKPDWIVI